LHRQSYSNLNSVELRRFLQNRLPPHMIPSQFVFLDALPLTPNGKVDRERLPEPDTQRPVLQVAYVPPSTAVEKVLADIWSEILGIDKVGRYDNYFELGGDSLLILRVISQANHAGLPLMPKHLFRHQTIAELATVITTETSS
jgi:hypothetical protein